jgi:hypothetical protein
MQEATRRSLAMIMLLTLAAIAQKDSEEEHF